MSSFAVRVRASEDLGPYDLFEGDAASLLTMRNVANAKAMLVKYDPSTGTTTDITTTQGSSSPVVRGNRLYFLANSTRGIEVRSLPW